MSDYVPMKGPLPGRQYEPYAHVRFWKRGERWTNNGPDQEPNPANVQFCALCQKGPNAVTTTTTEPTGAAVGPPRTVGLQPYYRDEAVTLYHGNAMDLLPLMP